MSTNPKDLKTALQYHAFTLIELLVVIAIVALGALMLVPALARTGSNSPTVQCLNNLSQLQRAFTMYAVDCNGQLPGQGASIQTSQDAYGYTNWCVGWLDWNASRDNTNTATLLNAALASYTGRRTNVYKCPADRLPSYLGPRVRSYSMNGFVGGTVESALNVTGYRIYFKDTDFTLPGPAKTFVFVDEHPDSINDTCLEQYMPTASAWPSAASWCDLPASYHVGAGCLSFADGHVEAHKWLDANTRAPVLRSQNLPWYYTISPHDNPWLVARATAPL